MKAREIMTKDPICCTPDQTIAEAAKLMREHDCGCLPVVEDTQTRKIVGTITDRDIACRCVAEGKGSDTLVREAMSSNPSCCRGDDEVAAVERVMAERKVRRVPIVDESGCCVGIIAQADIARKAGDDHEVAKVVERVSEPTSGARTKELQIHEREEVTRITVDEVKQRIDRGEPVVFLDSRSEKSWEESDMRIRGAIRVPPDMIDEHLGKISPTQGLMVSYCT